MELDEKVSIIESELIATQKSLQETKESLNKKKIEDMIIILQKKINEISK